MSALLDVRNLTIKVGAKTLVNDVSFELAAGDSLGILGESGSGKSLTCKAIIGLLPKHFKVEGEVFFQGENLLVMSRPVKTRLRGRRIGFIMQNPMGAFDPLETIGGQMVETMQAHLDISAKEALEKAECVLGEVLIRNPGRVLRQYPHELSGGMLQRVMIGLALSLEPDLLIGDEPTTALDVITQYEVMSLFQKIRQSSRSALVLVSHDLGVIAKTAGRLLVMHQGRVLEIGPIEKVFRNPEKEQTRYLIDSRLVMMKKFHEQLRGWEQ